MANIFEELMLKHQELSDTTLAESLKRKSVKTEAKKINFKKLRVESFKIFEEEDLDKLDQDFAADIEDEKTDEDEVVLVIDPELPPEEEVPEDAAEQLVGDYVYKCPVCGANYVCGCDAAETEAIEVDEDGVPVECPVCGDDSEQILVGEIAPVEDVEKSEDEEEMEPVDNEDEKEDAEEEEVEETEEVVEEESLKRRPLVRRSIKTESVADSDLSPTTIERWARHDILFDKEINSFDQFKRRAEFGEGVNTDEEDYQTYKKLCQKFKERQSRGQSLYDFESSRKESVRRRKKVVKESAGGKVAAICSYLSSLGDRFTADLVGGGSVLSIWQDLLSPSTDWKNFSISDWEGATIDEIREKIEDSSSRWYLSDNAKITFDDDGVSFRNPKGYLVKIYPHESVKTESKKKVVKEGFEEGDYIRYKSGVNDLFTPDQLYQVEYFEDGYMYYSPINRAASKALAKWNEENDADPDDFGFVEVEVADDQFDKAELESVRRRKKVKEDYEDDVEFSDDIELVEPECPECEVEEKVEEEPKVEVNADKVEIVLDDMRFNKLMSKMIKENYKGSPQFKLTKIKSSKNTLTLEYVVRTGKKNIKGQFIAEGFDTKSRTMKLRMRDKGVFTESLTRIPSFVVECVRIRNKIVPTSVRYNFTKKVDESLYRVKGEVKNSK